MNLLGVPLPFAVQKVRLRQCTLILLILGLAIGMSGSTSAVAEIQNPNQSEIIKTEAE